MTQTEFRTSGTGFGTGTICTDTNLYKCTDNKVEYIEHIAAGTPSRTSRVGTAKAMQSGFRSP